MLNNQLLLQGSTGYSLSKSLRFRSSASAYLSRTPASSSNRRTWTWSAWVKRGALGSVTRLFSADNGGQQTLLRFQSDDTIQFQIYNSGVAGQIITTQVFRDPSAWYHIVAVMDTVDATSSNRMKLYVNGTQVTSLSTASYPSQNYDAFVNQNILHSTSSSGSSEYWDGYLTEVNFIDGQALTPSSFGSTNSQTGVWQPKKYAGTYGTNGFYLPFTDVATTSGSNAGLGKDFSGNGNYWTTNNISVTAGTTYDSMNDVPTLTSTTTANYCVLNPLNSYSANTLSNGNLNVVFSDATTSRTTFSTIGVTSGKFYWEMTVTATGGGYYPGIGVNNNLAFPNSGQSGDTSAGFMYLSTGEKFSAGLSSYGSSYTTNDVIGVALDMDAGTITFYKNNTSQGQAYSGITGTAVPCFIGDANASCAVNFGQRPFSYTPPTGFVALNTFNLPEPSIKAGNKHFDATTYTGNITARDIVNSGGFQPDLIWIKERGGVGWNNFTDSIRGVTKNLYSNATNAEATNNGTNVTSFNANGFSLGVDSAGDGVNRNGIATVAWQWKAGNSAGSSNTAGSITSTVSANPTAGFSVVTYTGSGSNGTVGHGLGVAPRMIFVKDRTQGGTYRDWAVYNADIGAGNSMYLNSTSGSFSKPSYWNSTTATSSVFSLGSDITVNQSGDAYVAYCFAPVSGYSAFGSYTGNGSADGPFVHLGFRPKFVMIKIASGGSGNWEIFDTARNTYNQMDLLLLPSSSNAESNAYGSYYVDFTANGFKVRGLGAGFNGSGETLIYAAFAETPTKYALGR